MYRVKPSKPVAVFGAVFGLAILVFGAVTVHSNIAFLALWLVLGLAIIGFNLWSAFAKNGSTENIVASTDANGVPHIPGYTVTRDAGATR